MTHKVLSGSRNVAIVGPYSSGKTTLLESLLAVTGAISRKGGIPEGNTVGDSTPEARDHKMTVEINAACTQHGGINFTFVDCPGSVELLQETCNALIGVDAAIVVCEPDPSRALTVSPLLQFLDSWEIPHLLWINKIDRSNAAFSDVVEALKSVSSRPLVLHQYPIGMGGKLVGFIDLISEQAYHYHPSAPADPVPLPAELAAAEKAARAEMLETLADFDDHLLEELLEEIDPPQEEIVRDLKLDLGADLVVPVFIGVAASDYGVRPLLDALVRETPEPKVTAQNRGIDSSSSEPLAQVLKTYYSSQGGKLSLVRLWRGQIGDSDVLNGDRVGGIYQLMGQQTIPLNTAEAGSIVAIARLEKALTGDTLGTGPKPAEELPTADALNRVYALAIAPAQRSDEVKLSTALGKLLEEDPGLYWEQHGDTHEVILWGQGEMHLQIALERLSRKYHLPMTTHLPQVPYKETIRRSTADVHGRYKHQTGGHGQFGDVYIDIQPLPRGDGFRFSESVVGGAVPKQYIPGVETGVREALVNGPLGFPVVDIAVTLTNGSYHSVDSSEQAFKQAARLAMQTGMAACEPDLLEPIAAVEISVPNSFTSGVLRLISIRRGQILGYQAKPGWPGWDQVAGHLAVAEMQTLILELRSLTLGVGFFSWQYDHLSPVPDKLRSQILARQAPSEF
ncbi:elongation factor G [Romeria aff. gracilis LEGE 07310]|uniref:Elongation factor G n=1 Tax=Vasconcelosia minhoensis LEGE 07310 TaxID=915328 RepID=A0A8J7DRX0_9CYAN|nr:elongation factor G [Romeria gracilis]MBE9079459.1 elongation factor G [Romeria aff. gracilis LEGE 07310]